MKEKATHVVHSQACQELEDLHEHVLHKLEDLLGYPKIEARCNAMLRAQTKACGDEPTPYVKAKWAFRDAKIELKKREAKLLKDTAINSNAVKSLPGAKAQFRSARAISEKIGVAAKGEAGKVIVARKYAAPYVTSKNIAYSTYSKMRNALNSDHHNYHKSLQNENVVAERTARERSQKQAAAIAKARKDASERGSKHTITEMSKAVSKAKESVRVKAAAAAKAAKIAAAASEKAKASPTDENAQTSKAKAEAAANNSVNAAKAANTALQKAQLSLDKAKKSNRI